ncbi:hypothetical protein AK830_g13 [Neonectria ditissima]|uniref:Uncharacterized protein n=1 Tax=Neonectria ditissima TaxID=78410 RepID=A0A0P7BYW2_9HYPO|nr:hypothetical protein AK830_g13 [Neonectria ditissima]
MPPSLRSDVKKTTPRRAGRGRDQDDQNESSSVVASRARERTSSRPRSSSRPKPRANVAESGRDVIEEEEKETEKNKKKESEGKKKKRGGKEDDNFAQLNLSVRLKDEATAAFHRKKRHGILCLYFYFAYGRLLHSGPLHITFAKDGTLVASKKDPGYDDDRIRSSRTYTKPIDLRPDDCADQVLPPLNATHLGLSRAFSTPLTGLAIGSIIFLIAVWADSLAGGLLVVLATDVLRLTQRKVSYIWNYEEYESTQYASPDQQAQSLFSNGARILAGYGNLAFAMLLSGRPPNTSVGLNIQYARLVHEVASPAFGKLQMTASMLDKLELRAQSKKDGRELGGDSLSDEIFGTQMMFHGAHRDFEDACKDSFSAVQSWHGRALFDLETLHRLISDISDDDDYAAYKAMNAFENSIINSGKEPGLMERNVRRAYIRAGKLIKALDAMEMANNVSIRFVREKLNVDISVDETPGGPISGRDKAEADKTLIMAASTKISRRVPGPRSADTQSRRRHSQTRRGRCVNYAQHQQLGGDAADEPPR